MKAMGTKIKIYQLKNILNVKSSPNLKVHSGNEVNQFEEWKILLTMSINLFLLRILMRPVI